MIEAREKRALGRLYRGRKVYHGELHDHSASGGTSDGKCPFAEWPDKLRALKMDFAAILDHRQVRHMYLPEWKDGLFIPGTEPGTEITDSKASCKGMHYNILLPDRDLLADLLAAFPEFQFTGGLEGHFSYPKFTTARFGELIDAVKARGGFFVHPHPKQTMKSDDPVDYWFRNGTGLEVFYIGMDTDQTKANYALWTDLLQAGKRVFATAGCDLHAEPRDTALTTIYAEAHSAKAYLPHLAAGDFTCGAVGVRQCIGKTATGGTCAFQGNRLVVRIGDFHDSVRIPGHEYRADILNETGVVLSGPVFPNKDTWFALDAANARFWRTEVFDVTRNLRIAIGNPIWNAVFFAKDAQ
jgi:hypothetical protein